MKKINILIIAFILTFIGVLFLLKKISDKMSPILFNYANIEAKKFTSVIIMQSVNEEVIKTLDTNNLYIINNNTIDINQVVINKFILDVSSKIQNNLYLIENGDLNLDLNKDILINYNNDLLKKGVFIEIPMGVMFNNNLLANLGPKIPVKFSLIGDVLCNVDTKLTNYGINNALLETVLKVSITEKVILPITSNDLKVDIDIHISTKIIQGSVPNYYLNR